jgi:hypothetical protein
MKSAYALIVITLFLVLSPGCGGDGSVGTTVDPYPGLPTPAQVQANRSDRFLVDVQYVDAGIPFKGRRANTPHQGAHVHWDNTSNIWPAGGTAPSNYPAIYAVADGYVDRIDYRFPVGLNDRYGIDIAYARAGSTIYRFSYSIEPMVPEPSDDFYKQFILVSQGQRVTKGDIIAYMYLPPGAGIGSHIHFHIKPSNAELFLAPAVFTEAVVDAFFARWGTFANDGTTPMPSCMGYMLDADENPYGNVQVDVLK